MFRLQINYILKNEAPVPYFLLKFRKGASINLVDMQMGRDASRGLAKSPYHYISLIK